MAGDSDIRSWARDRGINIADRGRVPAEVRQQWEQEHPNTNGSAPSVGPEPPGGHEAEPEVTVPVTPVTAGETRPKQPKRGRLFARNPNRKRKSRVSLEQLGAAAYGIAGRALAKTRLYPVGRVLSMQAPVAGLVLEEELAGTMADRVAQPVARLMAKGGTLGALAVLPAAVAAYQLTGSPELLPVIEWAFVQQVILAKSYEAELKERRDKMLADAGLTEQEIREGIQALFARDWVDPEDREPAAA